MLTGFDMQEEKRKKLMLKIIDAAIFNQEGHIPSCLSVLDIIDTLYNEVLDLSSIKNELEDRDRFILSKGHSSSALFAVLDELNMLKYSDDSICDYVKIKTVHPINKLKYIDFATGSLGHGLSVSVGMAMAYKIKNFKHKVYCLVGDGEAHEGSTWEGALLAGHHKLNNLVCIMDYNHSGDSAIKLDNLIDKFASFNWTSTEIDGHNQEDMLSALRIKKQRPLFVLAHTTKGKGCKIMEKNPGMWHHRFPNEEEYLQILKDL